MPNTQTLIILVSAFAVAAVGTFLLTPVAAWIAHRVGAIDFPGGRRIHASPTPRLGGLAIFGGLALGAGCYGVGFGFESLLSVLSADPLLAFLVPCLLIFIVGLIDDIRGLGPGPRLVIEAVAASFLIQAGYVIDNVTNPFGLPMSLGMFAYPVTLVWIVGITNAFNLIDGLDGLLSSVGFVVLSSCGVVAALSDRIGSATLALALAGALIGFLPRNRHPAKIFMGDSGSLVIGFTVAAISLKAATTSAGTLSFHVAVALCALPIGETVLTLARRYVNGQPYFAGDRSHIHHVLVNKGLSVPKAVRSLTLVTGLFCAIAVLARYWRREGMAVAMFLLLVAAVLGLRWLGYIEIRVIGDRLRHNLFRRRRRGLPHLLALAQARQIIEEVDTITDLPRALAQCVELGIIETLSIRSQLLPALDTNASGEWSFTTSVESCSDTPQITVATHLPIPPNTGEFGVMSCTYSTDWDTPAPSASDAQRYLAWPLSRLLMRLWTSKESE